MLPSPPAQSAPALPGAERDRAAGLVAALPEYRELAARMGSGRLVASTASLPGGAVRVEVWEVHPTHEARWAAFRVEPRSGRVWAEEAGAWVPLEAWRARRRLP